MRLTCPNCGAQYEVPDDVIPEEGRDVQCSNCGDTWFQQAAGYVAEAITAPAAANETQSETASHDTSDVEIGSLADPAQIDDDVTPDPPPAQSAAQPAEDHGSQEHHDNLADAEQMAELADDLKGSPEQPPLDAPAATDFVNAAAAAPARPDKDAAPQQRGLDPSLSEILREEAEREASLRAAANTQQALETQPNLGLDDLPEDEDARRARQAKDRMARIRGEDPRRLAAEASGLKRGVLPDIEEINSTLRASDSAPAPTQNARAPRPRKSGFTRGFALAVLLIVALLMIYSNASQIAEFFPQADPYLSSFVTSVDHARLWLDTQVKTLQQPQF